MVRGLVQGVNFRAAAASEATALRIFGRVWNRADGAVELIAEGDERALDELAAWLARGPRFAEVMAVERPDLAGEQRYREFVISDGPAG